MNYYIITIQLYNKAPLPIPVRTICCKHFINEFRMVISRTNFLQNPIIIIFIS